MNAKKRLVKYLKVKGITQYDFSKRTGLSNGYLNSGDNLTTANLDIITDSFNDLNLTWIVKGIGSMIISGEKKPIPYSIGSEEGMANILNEDYQAWMSENWEEKSNMPSEEYIKIIKLFKIVLRSKDETIQTKNERISTLEQLLAERDQSFKKDKDK